MRILILTLLLAGCGGVIEEEEYKCIDHKRFVKRGNIWSEYYGAPQCRSMEEVK